MVMTRGGFLTLLQYATVEHPVHRIKSASVFPHVPHVLLWLCLFELDPSSIALARAPGMACNYNQTTVTSDQSAAES